MMSKYAHKTAVSKYQITVAVRFKHIRDTIKECNRRRELYQPYVHCMNEPHFPVPTVLGEVFIGSYIVAVCRSEVRVWDGSAAEWIREDS